MNTENVDDAVVTTTLFSSWNDVKEYLKRVDAIEYAHDDEELVDSFPVNERGFAIAHNDANRAGWVQIDTHEIKPFYKFVPVS